MLTLRGAHVIAAARTLEKARTACASVKGLTTPVACELAEPTSVRASVATVKARSQTTFDPEHAVEAVAA